MEKHSVTITIQIIQTSTRGMVNMKKKLSALLAAAMISGMVFGTSVMAVSNTSNTEPAAPSEAAPAASQGMETSSNTAVEKAAPEKGSIVKVGLGNSTSIAASKDFDPEKGATAQADAIFAAVGLDKDGKIAAIQIDNAQTRVMYNPDGTLKTDLNQEPKTKRDLGPDYGMIKASKIGKEWYQQMDAFEAWMIGKTIDEVMAIPVMQKDENHPAVPTEADLVSSVTISIESYQAAVKDAVESAIDVDGADDVKLGIMVSVAKSKAKDGEKGAVAQMDTTAVAVAEKDGKLEEAVIDTVQPKVEYDADGKVKSDKGAEIKTKQDLGDEYGMKKASKIGKEWYEQAKSLVEWMKGKTIDEIKAIKTEDKDGKKIPTEADLTSSVSVDVATYISIVDEAMNK